jgi:hypothetical protein
MKLPKYVHLTEDYLGEGCVLKPRIPTGIYSRDSYMIEDEVTPRVSFARSIDGALVGVPNASAEFFVYGADELYGFYAPGKTKCPASPGNPYGLNFRWSDYAEYVGVDPKDDKFRWKVLTGCVPDADKSTEVWATEPTVVELVGMLAVRNRKNWKFVPIDELDAGILEQEDMCGLGF